MFLEEYGPFILFGLGLGVLMVVLLLAELFVVRANRRLIRDSTRELAQLLARAGKPEEGAQFAKGIQEALELQRERVLRHVKRRARR